MSASRRPELEPLAQIARETAARWGVEVAAPYALSNYSYVCPAGEDTVLKVRPADDDESDQEAEALALWGGNGAVRLLHSERGGRALLLERAKPGDDIAELAEDQAIAIAVDLGPRLWRPAGEPFRWIGDFIGGWLKRARQPTPPGRELLALARELYGALEPGRSVLVHGDFHHHNILDAGDRHAAIDPKPMLGEPEYDVAPFLWNPIGSRMSAETARRRLAAFADAGLDQERMLAWTVIRGACLRVDRGEVEAILALAR